MYIPLKNIQAEMTRQQERDEQSMNKKMIFLDLDGTLLDDEKNLPQVNREAIAAALAAGHKVLICTGRPLCSAIKLLPEFGLDRQGCYAITYNGGLVYDAGAQKVVYKKTLSMEQVKFLFEKAAEYGGIHIQTYTDDGFICEADTKEGQDYERIIKAERKVVKNVIDELAGRNPCKVLAIAHGYDRERIEGFRRSMVEHCEGRLEVYFSSAHYLEFMPLGIDKGNAIRWMSEFLGIPMEHTIAVGDAENDITMIQTAAVGAVMKNADQKIKQYGNYITEKNNNEGGVAEVIYKFMLEQEKKG